MSLSNEEKEQTYLIRAPARGMKLDRFAFARLCVQRHIPFVFVQRGRRFSTVEIDTDETYSGAQYRIAHDMAEPIIALWRATQPRPHTHCTVYGDSLIRAEGVPNESAARLVADVLELIRSTLV